MFIQNLEQNSPPPIPFQQKIIQNQENVNKFTNQIYDEEFVSLINGLNESIKEYYKVSRNNILEANNFLSFYEQQGQAIQSLMDEIINSNSYERINEIFEQIPKINEIMSQIQNNTNSNEKNLNLFFEDAKMLFKKMKIKRKEKIIEINSYNNSYNNSNNNIIKSTKGLNDSFSNSFNVNQGRNIGKNNLINKKGNILNKSPDIHSRRIQNNQNSNQINSLLIYINRIYSQIMKLINSLSDYNYMISRINFEASNKYNGLQNNIKRQLDDFMNVIKNNLSTKNQNIMLNSIKSLNNFNDDQNVRSKSMPGKVNQELEKLKRINQINEKKIVQLTNQLNSYRVNINSVGNDSSGYNFDTTNKIKELEIKMNKLNSKYMKAEQQIKERDNIIQEYQKNFSNNKMNIPNNNTPKINTLLNQKDNQILNLQQQLYVYQKNESLFNSQISDLNKKFQTKINQYQAQIAQINNKNGSLSKELSNYKNENNENKKEIEHLKKIINSHGMPNIPNNNNLSLEYEQTIQILKNDISNYQNKINQYENKIRELSNNNGINNIGNNNLNIQNHKLIEEQKMKINQLNKEIINYQRKVKLNEENNNKYIKQIEDMNNNILYTNKIIEQKDELIKHLSEKKNSQVTDLKNNNNDNNIFLELEKERDKYKFQLEQMQKKYMNSKEEKLSNSNSIDPQNRISNGKNVNLQNNEFMSKMKELTLENQRYKEQLIKTKEDITKLESDIKKKNDELEGMKTFIFKLQSQLEKDADNKARLEKKVEQKSNMANNNLRLNENKKEFNKSNFDQNKSFEAKDTNHMISNILNQLNDAEQKISRLQNKNKELQFQLEEKQVEKEISGYRTEDINFSNYEEEFDLKKMVNGAREKNRSEDINIDYPGVQGLKDKYKELLQNMNMLEEQVKILICNISCNNKIKPQITQICQLMRIPAKNIQLIIAGKDKKKALGLVI